MDLERADTFTVYKDMGDIVNPPVNNNGSASSQNKFALFHYSSNRPNGRVNINHGSLPITAKSERSVDRPVTSGVQSGQSVFEEDDGIMDEEHWNWSALIARVFAFFLLFLIILCIGLEAITRRFLILAAIICVLLVIVIIGTYIDLREKCCWWLCPRDQKINDNPIESSSTSASVTNPLVTGADTKIQIANRHGNR